MMRYLTLALAMLTSSAMAAPSAGAALYRHECAACHIAYPADMLPFPAWQHILKNLPRHYGTDASLDAATVQQLSAWLDMYAGRGRRAHEMPPEDRITRSAWFIRKHDELSPSVWARPSIKGPSNCMACHARSDQGDFNEHDIHIPR